MVEIMNRSHRVSLPNATELLRTWRDHSIYGTEEQKLYRSVCMSIEREIREKSGVAPLFENIDTARRDLWLADSFELLFNAFIWWEPTIDAWENRAALPQVVHALRRFSSPQLADALDTIWSSPLVDLPRRCSQMDEHFGHEQWSKQCDHETRRFAFLCENPDLFFDSN